MAEMAGKACTECGEQIVFLETDSGKQMPVDADTWTEGETRYDAEVHTSHFASCPAADKFRKSRDG